MNTIELKKFDLKNVKCKAPKCKNLIHPISCTLFLEIREITRPSISGFSSNPPIATTYDSQTFPTSPYPVIVLSANESLPGVLGIVIEQRMALERMLIQKYPGSISAQMRKNMIGRLALEYPERLMCQAHRDLKKLEK